MATTKPKPKTAQQLVQEVLGPQIAASNQAYRNKGASANAAYAAAAEMQQGVAPAITDTYNAASAREAVMAKGLAVGQQLAEQETAGASNSLLAQNNSPQQVKASGAGGILATLGGLSASGLNREGAAFSAAAQWLPTQSLNLGIDAVKQAGLEGVAARGALEAQRPGLVTAARGQLAADNLNLRQDARAERELKLREKESNRPNAQLFGSGETGYMTFDSKTGKVVRLTDPAPAGASAPELIGSADNGYYAWNEGTGELTPVLAAPEKPKYTAKEIREDKKDAANMAYDAFWGVKGKDGTVSAQPLHYQQALAYMLDQQIPLDIAQNALNKHWKKPGFWSYKEDRMNGQVRWIDHKKQSEEGATGRPLKPVRMQNVAAREADEWQEWVGVPEKRTGPSAPHRPEILQFVGRIGQITQTKLTPWGNESHSLKTVNGRPSAHATGRAADIPASGDDLIRLGQAALIAAGAKPEWARKQTRGLFNIGGKQIIFNTDKGGNHFDHLHVGLRS